MMLNGLPLMYLNSALTVKPLQLRHFHAGVQNKIVAPIGIQRPFIQVEILLGQQLKIVIGQCGAAVVAAGVAERVTGPGAPEPREPPLQLKVEAIVPGFASVVEPKIDRVRERRNPERVCKPQQIGAVHRSRSGGIDPQSGIQVVTDPVTAFVVDVVDARRTSSLRAGARSRSRTASSSASADRANPSARSPCSASERPRDRAD